MERRLVNSSNLYSVGYDEERLVLEIEFRSGGIYSYYGVPREVYQELMGAPSLGRYFLANIRDQYRYAKAA